MGLSYVKCQNNGNIATKGCHNTGKGTVHLQKQKKPFIHLDHFGASSQVLEISHRFLSNIMELEGTWFVLKAPKKTMCLS